MQQTTTTQTSSPPQIPSGLLIPWLALGAGLAGLVNVQDGQISAPAAAEPPPITAGVSAPAADFVAALADPPNMLVPPVVSGPAIQFMAGVPSINGLISAEAPFVSPSSLSTPAQIDRMFAVDSGPIKSLPPALQHPGAAAPSVIEWTSRYPEASAEQWAELRWCESSGNYGATSASGRYRGAYQFDQATWETVGGTGDPATAPPAEQDKRAKALYAERGASPWPYCGRYLG